MWIVITSVMLTPFISIVNYRGHHAGSIAVGVLSGTSFVISLIGYASPRTRSLWFIGTAIMSLLLFAHAWKPIVGIPIQS